MFHFVFQIAVISAGIMVVDTYEYTVTKEQLNRILNYLIRLSETYPDLEIIGAYSE